MAKIITREEVNTLKPGTFSSNLTMAVLYEEVSGNTDFVVQSVNSESNVEYTPKQALLETDIRLRGSVTVKLTPEKDTVPQGLGFVYFNITTGGTGEIESYNIYSVTYGGVDYKHSAQFTDNNTKVSFFVPDNESYYSKEIHVRISVTTTDSDTVLSNIAKTIQNPTALLQFSAATQTVESTATTASQVYGTNCTDIGLYSASTYVSTSGINTTTRTVTVGFSMNSLTSQRTHNICISGKTPDNTTTYARHTITQKKAEYTNVAFTYDGDTLTPASGSTSDFTITLINASLTSVSSTSGKCTTGGTESSPTLTFEYPENTDNTNNKTYTITLVATNIYGTPMTKTVTIYQSPLNASIRITLTKTVVDAEDTTNDFEFTYNNVQASTIGWVSSSSTNVNTCTIGTTNHSGTIGFDENNSYTEARTITLVVTGTSIAGTSVSDTVSFTQSKKGASYNPSIIPSTLDITLPAYIEGTYDGRDVSTSITFTFNDISGFTTACTTTGVSITGFVNDSSPGVLEISVPVNRATMPATGITRGVVTITGKGMGGTDVEMKITVYQEPGVSPTLSISPESQTIDASGTTANGTIKYNYINPSSIGEQSRTGNITDVTIS